MSTYEVRVAGRIYLWKLITVKAKNEEEAVKKARQVALEDPDDLNYEFDDIEWDNVDENIEEV